jgi:1,4-dihydroxy-2-naphthoate octaprenyltransferase
MTSNVNILMADSLTTLMINSFRYITNHDRNKKKTITVRKEKIGRTHSRMYTKN